MTKMINKIRNKFDILYLYQKNTIYLQTVKIKSIYCEKKKRNDQNNNNSNVNFIFFKTEQMHKTY